MASKPITSCKRYSVKFRDLNNNKHELGFYALDAYEARQLACEFNNYLRNHPNNIEKISLKLPA